MALDLIFAAVVLGAPTRSRDHAQPLAPTRADGLDERGMALAWLESRRPNGTKWHKPADRETRFTKTQPTKPQVTKPQPTKPEPTKEVAVVRQKLAAKGGGEVVLWTQQLLLAQEGLAFTPDGTAVVCGDQAAQASMLDAKTGEVKWVKQGNGAVGTLATAPGGGTCAAFGNDVTMLDAKGDLKWVHSTLLGVNNLGFSPDASKVLVGDDAAQVTVLDAADGAVVWVVQLNSAVNTVAFAPDGKHAAAGDNTGKVTYFDEQGKAVWEHKDILGIQHLAFSSDGAYVLCGGDSAAVTVLDASGKVVWNRQLAGAINSVAFSPGDAHVAVGTGNGKLYLFDMSGEVVWEHSLLLGVTEGAARGLVAFSPDGSMVLCGDSAAQMTMVDAKDGDVQLNYQLDSAVMALAFSPDGSQVACGTADGKVTMFDTPSLKALHTIALHTSLNKSSAEAKELKVAQLKNAANRTNGVNEPALSPPQSAVPASPRAQAERTLSHLDRAHQGGDSLLTELAKWRVHEGAETVGCHSAPPHACSGSHAPRM